MCFENLLVALTESGVDSTLCSDGVRSGREQLGDASSLEASLRATHGSSQTSTTSTDDDSIVLVVNDRVLGGQGSSQLTVHLASDQGASRAIGVLQEREKEKTSGSLQLRENLGGKKNAHHRSLQRKQTLLCQLEHCRRETEVAITKNSASLIRSFVPKQKPILSLLSCAGVSVVDVAVTDG
jgi:hypothetical protein